MHAAEAHAWLPGKVSRCFWRGVKKRGHASWGSMDAGDRGAAVTGGGQPGGSRRCPGGRPPGGSGSARRCARARWSCAGRRRPAAGAPPSPAQASLAATARRPAPPPPAEWNKGVRYWALPGLGSRGAIIDDMGRVLGSDSAMLSTSADCRANGRVCPQHSASEGWQVLPAAYIRPAWPTWHLWCLKAALLRC